MGPPVILGCAGFYPSDQTLHVVIGHEWPIAHEGSRNLPKSDLEAIHLDRYCTDHLLACGELPYVGTTRGSDPPDFVGTALDGQQIRIDFTQLGLHERRLAQSPGRDGFIYPSEEAFAELVFYAHRRPLNCKNLRRVVLHSWFNGAITQIFPKYEQIARPVFAGHVAPHLDIGSMPGDGRFLDLLS